MSTPRILLLGGTGFVGRNVAECLAAGGLEPVIAARRNGVDLRKLDDAVSCFRVHRPDIVVNCAAHVGSLVYVHEQAADVLDDNLRILINTYRALSLVAPEAVTINPIANCAFPARLNLFREEDLWNGDLHESVKSYGSTRRMMLVLSEAYRYQHGLRSVNLFVPNMYGPYESTDPTKAHALNALVSKAVKAKKEGHSHLEVWGTGVAVREWLYARDFARIVLEVVARRRDEALDAPVNVGQNFGLSVRDLVDLVVAQVGFRGEVIWDKSKPDGAAMKTMDDARFRTLFPKFSFTTMQDGIGATIAYYESRYPY